MSGDLYALRLVIVMAGQIVIGIGSRSVPWEDTLGRTTPLWRTAVIAAVVVAATYAGISAYASHHSTPARRPAPASSRSAEAADLDGIRMPYDNVAVC